MRHTILTVDDQDLVRRVIRRMLSERFRVLEASSAAIASALFEADGSVDLLVTDIAMPDMTGLELAASLRERRPDLPIVFVSGELSKAAADAFGPRMRFLAKPFSAQELLSNIDDLLAGR